MTLLISFVVSVAIYWMAWKNFIRAHGLRMNHREAWYFLPGQRWIYYARYGVYLVILFTPVVLIEGFGKPFWWMLFWLNSLWFNEFQPTKK